MEKAWEAFSAIGGLAFIGGLIDFAMSRAQKDRLRKALETWWLQFDDVRWRSFGRKEAQGAVAFLDGCAGAKLWSWKRWRRSLCIGAIVGILSYAFELYQQLPHGSSAAAPYSFAILSFAILLSVFPLTIVGFALSISLTRFISIVVSNILVGTSRDIFVLLGLFVFQLVMLAYWSAVTDMIVAAPGLTYMYVYGVAGDKNFLTLGALWGLLTSSLDRVWAGWGPIPLLSGLFSHRPEPYAMARALFKASMDILSNGARITFAGVFLASFLFRPLVQRPISWLWLRILESGKPIFGLLFGAIGVAIKLVQWALT